MWNTVNSLKFNELYLLFPDKNLESIFNILTIARIKNQGSRKLYRVSDK